ncbi:MAG: DNA repair protein RecN [Geminicoccaceae bacterium]
MLKSLAIRDIVLIDRLGLGFAPGLSVLTGETGAGKSIILDALGLALGGRGDRGLVRSGAEQGSVVAEFDLPAGGPWRELLEENALPCDGELILRRVVTADGRSRAFVNDTSVSGALLRQMGDLLVEVHGQFDQRGLLNPQAHREILDAFGGLGEAAAETRQAHLRWRGARDRVLELESQLDAARREEDYLRHRLHELGELDPRQGEEEELAQRRHALQNREKVVATLSDALAAVAGEGGALARLGAAERRLERSAGLAPELLEPAAAALGRALIEAAEAEAVLEAALRDMEGERGTLEAVEERLFALREVARKHRVTVDGLPELLAETGRLLEQIDVGAESLDAARHAAREAEAAFRAAARRLSQGRAAAATRLARAVEAELPPLRLDRAQVRVQLEPLPEAEWAGEGAEHVAIEVCTNPGQPFGPLGKIASGGELSRFMLALKVVLARLDAATTLIFDEIDAGVGGATADAVGERLARLGRECQVLVVTHAPQIAARADHHYRVGKDVVGGRTLVEVRELTSAERRDEVARMLAGAEVTEAARAAAASLMGR